jgi:hypothetical protein
MPVILREDLGVFPHAHLDRKSLHFYLRAKSFVKKNGFAYFLLNRGIAAALAQSV